MNKKILRQAAMEEYHRITGNRLDEICQNAQARYSIEIADEMKPFEDDSPSEAFAKRMMFGYSMVGGTLDELGRLYLFCKLTDKKCALANQPDMMIGYKRVMQILYEFQTVLCPGHNLTKEVYDEAVEKNKR